VPTTFAQYESRVVDALASTFSDSASAKMLLLRARYPREDIPDFRAPREFWTFVVRDICNGKGSGVDLVLEALALFEQNPLLQEISDLLDVSPGRSRRCQVEAKCTSQGLDHALPLIEVEPICRHMGNREWRLTLRVAFLRHRFEASRNVQSRISFAAAGAWLSADFQHSGVFRCFADDTQHCAITATRVGPKVAQWSCDSIGADGRGRGFLEGNEWLSVDYEGDGVVTVHVSSSITEGVFIDPHGRVIEGKLKHWALLVKLWCNAVRLPETSTTMHEIVLRPVDPLVDAHRARVSVHYREPMKLAVTGLTQESHQFCDLEVTVEGRLASPRPVGAWSSNDGIERRLKYEILEQSQEVIARLAKQEATSPAVRLEIVRAELTDTIAGLLRSHSIVATRLDVDLQPLRSRFTAAAEQPEQFPPLYLLEPLRAVPPENPDKDSIPPSLLKPHDFILNDEVISALVRAPNEPLAVASILSLSVTEVRRYLDVHPALHPHDEQVLGMLLKAAARH
jgi:hypothetical protein